MTVKMTRVAKVNNVISAFRNKCVECYGEQRVNDGLTRNQILGVFFVHDVKIPSAIWKNKIGSGRGILFTMPEKRDETVDSRVEIFQGAVWSTFGNNYNGELIGKDIQYVSKKHKVKIPPSIWQEKVSRGRFKFEIAEDLKQIMEPGNEIPNAVTKKEKQEAQASKKTEKEVKETSNKESKKSSKTKTVKSAEVKAPKVKSSKAKPAAKATKNTKRVVVA